MRGQADADIAASVAASTTCCRSSRPSTTRIKQGASAGADVTDDLDQRDQILAGISEEIGVRTVTRANNDMAIYTDSGVTLFDTTPRAVTFDPTHCSMPSTTGAPVYRRRRADHRQHGPDRPSSGPHRRA